jgi:hypothetical protein
MPLRERVRQAIDAPVTEAAALLDEARDATESERLLIFVNGWFRGISAALEELAIEIDRVRDDRPVSDRPTRVPVVAQGDDVKAEQPESQDGKSKTRPPEDEAVERDEAALAERARMSREKTAAVRQESGGTEASEA